MFRRIQLSRLPPGWPIEVQDALARRVRGQAAAELVIERELVAVFDALTAEGVLPIVLKGTALAYSIYDAPWMRPRVDTDVLIRADQADVVRRVLGARGYSSPLHSGGELLFCQFPLRRFDGVEHWFDFHWKISTQSVFAEVLTYEEVDGRTVPLPALGARTRVLAPVDALLLACIHPVMHHRNVETLIWMYDVHLLAAALSETEFEQFAAMAVAKQVAAICARQLARAQAAFGTAIPDEVVRRLAAAGAVEPSAAYLRPDRQWIDEIVSSLRGLPRWRDRARLVREILMPPPSYILQSYGIASSPLTAALVPVLYTHRLLVGGWKAIAGQK
jgi:hypothetical protein